MTGRLRDIVVALVAALAYLALDTVIQEERAFAIALSLYVFYVLITTKRQFKRATRFWIVVGAFAALHILVLSILPLPRYSGPSIVALPLALVDGFVMWVILKWAERHDVHTAR